MENPCIHNCIILWCQGFTHVGGQIRRAAQSRRIGENRRTAQSRRAGPMSPCHVIAKLSHRKRIVVHNLNKLTIINVTTH